MTPSEWAQLKEWFGAALDASPDQIERIVHEAERESPVLADELRALLREHDAGGLRTATINSPREIHRLDVEAPATVGPYSVLGELGRGGTGIVFLAERTDDEFHRPVALKLLRYGQLGGHARDILTRERQMLSQLQHANIASLLDWGETSEGSPWLATEYVAGVAIDQYCDDHALDVPGTLAVFEQVCEAVQYAHRRLVVHRDLKPGNILVTDAGVAKLLDFGISKALESGPLTLTGDRRFTPAYASPEQLQGRPITSATDIYALGLLLYELLTGVLPHDGDTVESLVKRLDDKELPPPSQAEGLSRERRRAIAGDLDRIVLHALERDPERRYGSVEQLLGDLHRYGSGFPITARRASLAYRAGKFVRRNALPVSALSLAAIALVAGAAVAIANARVARQEQQRSEQRFKELQGLAHSVIFDLHDSIRGLPGSTPARRLLITTAVKYLDGLNAEGVADDSLQMELASGYIRMAYVQGGTHSVNIGDTAGAYKSYRAALRILDEQWRKRPADEQVGTYRWGAAYNLSMMINDPAAGAELARRYATEADEWSRHDRTAPPLQAVELLHSALGRILRRGGQAEAALHEFDLAADAQARVLPLTATDAVPRPMFAVSIIRGQEIYDMGQTAISRTEALLDLGRPREALESIQYALRRVQEATATNPDGKAGVAERRSYMNIHGLTALSYLALGRMDEADGEARQELAAAEENATDGSSTGLRDLAQARRRSAAVRCARADMPGCLGHLALATSLISDVTDADPAFALNFLDTALAYNAYGDALRRVNREDAARAAFMRAAEAAAIGVKEAPAWLEFRHQRERALAGLER